MKLGDDSKMSVMERGNMKLLIGGMIHVITNVYYLHGLRNNLYWKTSAKELDNCV